MGQMPKHLNLETDPNRKYMQEIGDVSDAQLVTSVARYSEVALAEVYRRHGGAVYGLARRVS